VVPLCIACHDELHDIGKWSFQDKYGIDFAFEAEETETKWRIHAGAVSVIQGDQ
jgi:hypothetical protein